MKRKIGIRTEKNIRETWDVVSGLYGSIIEVSQERPGDNTPEEKEDMALLLAWMDVFCWIFDEGGMLDHILYDISKKYCPESLGEEEENE